MSIINISDLTYSNIQQIWQLVGKPNPLLSGTVGWSFEGNGIRTRTAFTQAFRDLGLSFTELPNLLKTSERPVDLAGYLDPFYCLYVVRESNHERLEQFALASSRPVINAMSSQGHPCEVLTDAFYINSQLIAGERQPVPIRSTRICLWGPTTNVMRSWHELAKVLDFQLIHACNPEFHESKPNVVFTASKDSPADVVITDSWPAGIESPTWSLSKSDLIQMGCPKLLPTPPFSIGRELGFDPLEYEGFVGYEQKKLLLAVQKALIRFVLGG